MIDTTEMLTTSQASRLLGVCDQTVRGYVRQGKLPHTATPYGALFAPDDVEQLRQERETRIAGSPAAGAGQ